MEPGKFMVPRKGMMCHTLSGLPISTMMNMMHMVIAVMASISPNSTISLIGLKL